MCPYVRLSVRIFPDHNFTIVDGFQNNLTQLFYIMWRYAIWNIFSGKPKVKVTLEGQILSGP